VAQGTLCEPFRCRAMERPQQKPRISSKRGRKGWCGRIAMPGQRDFFQTQEHVSQALGMAMIFLRPIPEGGLSWSFPSQALEERYWRRAHERYCPTACMYGEFPVLAVTCASKPTSLHAGSGTCRRHEGRCLTAAARRMGLRA